MNDRARPLPGRPARDRRPHRWHAPVAARRQGDTADFRPVRQTGTFKLLRKKAADEYRQPAADGSLIIYAGKGEIRQTQDLGRCKAKADQIVQKKVMKFIGTDDMLSLLGNLAVTGRQQLGADRRIEDIQQDISQCGSAWPAA